MTWADRQRTQTLAPAFLHGFLVLSCRRRLLQPVRADFIIHIVMLTLEQREAGGSNDSPGPLHIYVGLSDRRD